MHLVFIWVISEPSPLTCSDSWLDSVEGQRTAAEGSSRFKSVQKAAILGGPLAKVREIRNQRTQKKIQLYSMNVFINFVPLFLKANTYTTTKPFLCDYTFSVHLC